MHRALIDMGAIYVLPAGRMPTIRPPWPLKDWLARQGVFVLVDLVLF